MNADRSLIGSARGLRSGGELLRVTRQCGADRKASQAFIDATATPPVLYDHSATQGDQR